MQSDAERKRRQEIIDNAIPTIIKNETFTGGKDDYPTRNIDHALRLSTRQDALDFNRQTNPDATLSADWRAVTTQMSPLIPSGGTVVDCGGNNGQYARFLALSRPDIKIIAIETDPARYELALENLKKDGLLGRVELRRGPLEEALNKIERDGTKVAAVSSIYRTHTQTDIENKSDFEAIAKLSEKTGASAVIHELHRPQLKETVNTMSSIFPAANSSPRFKEGFAAGLEGAYRKEELQKHIDNAFGDLEGAKLRFRPAKPMAPAQVQMYVIEGRNSPDPKSTPAPKFPPTDPEYAHVGTMMDRLMTAGEFINNPVGTVMNFIGLSDDKGSSWDSPAIEMPTILRTPPDSPPRTNVQNTAKPKPPAV